MLPKVKKPYVIYLAEVIYKDIADIKKNNLDISNMDAIEGFIGTKKYEEISSGKFHDDWFEYLKNNKFIDKESGEKVPDETIKLLYLQKDVTVKQLIKYPELYYAKNSFPLEIYNQSGSRLPFSIMLMCAVLLIDNVILIVSLQHVKSATLAAGFDVSVEGYYQEVRVSLRVL